MTSRTQSRLERWAPGHLNRIEQDIAEHAAAMAAGTTAAADQHPLGHAREIERLRAEAALVRLLVADRDTGVASMHYDLRPTTVGTREAVELARIKADGILSFLAQHSDLFTDAEMRRILAGPNAAPYRG